MLIGFKVTNFRSFFNEQSFSFVASSDRSHEATQTLRTGMKSVPRIAKAAIVFGPNATGKTNLLIALATCRDLILHSTSYSDAQLVERYTPFLFNVGASAPTTFEIDLLLAGVRYRYAFAFDAQRIHYERLLVYRTGKSQRWFERRFDAALQTDRWTAFSPSFSGPREMWRKATRQKALFLTAAAQLNSEQLAPLTHWIEHCFDIVFPSDLSDLARLQGYVENDNFKAGVLKLLRAVDIPIDDVRVSEADNNALELSDSHSTIKQVLRPPIEFLYARGSESVWLDGPFEAAGTHRLIAMFGPLLAAIEGGKLLLIDEFDTSLHPLVARFLIRLIGDPKISARGAQLLLTSHNTTLMDLDVLRRDEIWLMRLNAQRASQLAPLKESGPRKHELIAKGYLKGRYGAVPDIKPEIYTAR